MRRFVIGFILGGSLSGTLWTVASSLSMPARKQRGRIGCGNRTEARESIKSYDTLYKHQLQEPRGMNLHDIHAEPYLVHRS